jgi:integrase
MSCWDPDESKKKTQNARAVDDADARRQLQVFVAEVLEGKIPATRASTTVRTVAMAWLKHKEAAGRVGDATLAQAHNAVDKHILPELGNKRIRKLKAIHLERHYAVLQRPCKGVRNGLSAKSIAHVAGVMFQILEYARRADYVRWNVARDVVERPKADDRTVDVPDDRVVRKYLEKAQTIDFEVFAYVLISAATGARRGEVIALRRRDLLLDEGQIWFRASVTWRRRNKDLDGRRIDGPTVIVKEPKTPAGRRKVAVGEGVAAVLRELVRRLDAQAEHAGQEFPGDGFIFSADPLGCRPLYPSTITARFRKIGKEVGTRVHPHALRHYAATSVAPYLTETEMMGRFGWRTTHMIRRYSEYRAMRDAEAGAVMDRVLGLAPYESETTSEASAS